MTDPAHGMYYKRPLSRVEWDAVPGALVSGSNVLVVLEAREYPRQALLALDAGLEVRDCLAILGPDSTRVVLSAMRPLEGTFVENALNYGVAGYNIKDSTILAQIEGEHQRPFQPTNSMRSVLGKQTSFHPTNAPGRFPANLLLLHHEQCVCHGLKTVTPSNGSGKAYEQIKNRSNTVYGTGLPYREGVFGVVNSDGTENSFDWECHSDCAVTALDLQADGAVSFRNPVGTSSRFFQHLTSEVELDAYLTTLILPPAGVRVLLAEGGTSCFERTISLEAFS